MNQRHQLAPRRGRRLLIPALSILLGAGLAGCRHKVVTFPMPAAMKATAALEDPDADETAPLIATLPAPELAPSSVPPPAPPVRRKPPAPPKEEAPPQVASEAAPAMLAIGSLSTGADVTPQIQRQTRDLIASIAKRAAQLPARITSSQKRQIGQVRHFLEQAQQALSSGDAGGANNLATKAGLLMDILEKK